MARVVKIPTSLELSNLELENVALIVQLFDSLLKHI